MKKLFIVLFTCSAICSKAQITVDSQGNVGIGTSSTSLSKVSVNSTGYSDSEMTVLGRNIGIRAIHDGAAHWGNAIIADSKPANTNFAVGVRSEAHNSSPLTSGRTFGVFADAGNATSGWNYAVFGRLSGSNNGAAVYGTISNSENGVNTGGKYAGYFNGATKVAGNLTVTGAIDGVILSSSLPNNILSETYDANSEYDFSRKLQNLELSTYFIKEPTSLMQNELTGDTIADKTELTLIEKQNYEKLHYGINVNQLREIFPDIVYEKEDGTTAVNYMEMIPILVQTINELNNRIKSMEGAKARMEVQTRQTSSIDELDYGYSVLSQNSPNPFNTSTSISLCIPKYSNSAMLYFYDTSGKQIKEIDIRSTGKTEMNVNASDFNPGIYIYTLIVDGKCISSKRMIVTK